MKLIFVIGIFAVLCIQISHQIPFGKKDRKIPFPIPDKNVDGVKTFDFQVKNHGVRDVGQDGPDIGGVVGGKTIDDIKHQRFGKRFKHKDIKDGDGVFVDTDTVVEQKVFSKRGGLFDKIKDKVKENIPFVKRDVDEHQIPSNEKPVISKTSNFDLGTGVHVEQVFVDSEIEKEKEIQIVKRGWFKKLWKKIKNVVVESLLGMIKRSSNNDLQKQESIKNENNDLKDIEVVLSDDIIEVDLGNDFENEEEKEKAIQKVKRGWFKKIRRKIVKVLTGAVVGSVVGGIVKRGSFHGSGKEVEEKEEVVVDASKVNGNNLPLLLKTLRLRPGTADQITEIVQKLGGDLNGQDPEIIEIPDKEVVPEDVKPEGGNLPLLLKTLRLRPGTADQITEIVQKLGGSIEFQDEMIDEILNDDNDVEDGEDNTVLKRNGKSVRCRFVRGKFICF